MPFGKQNEFVRKVSHGLHDRMKTKSSPELIMNMTFTTFRTGHLVRLLAAQRQTLFAENRKLTGLDNALYACSLAFAGIGVAVNGSELMRRMRSGESLLGIEPVPKIDAELISSSVIDIGAGLAAASTGHTLFKKRELSSYGRVYRAVEALAGASRLGLHVASVAKA